MTSFRYPITLTFVQFGFVAAYCLLFMSPVVRFSKLRRPNKAIIQSTLPMGVFQVGGHIFSSMAISRIPVSTVHTIKVSTASHITGVVVDLIPDPGALSLVHGGRLCVAVWRQLLAEDLHIAPPADARGYVGVQL